MTRWFLGKGFWIYLNKILESRLDTKRWMIGRSVLILGKWRSLMTWFHFGHSGCCNLIAFLPIRQVSFTDEHCPVYHIILHSKVYFCGEWYLSPFSPLLLQSSSSNPSFVRLYPRCDVHPSQQAVTRLQPL